MNPNEVIMHICNAPFCNNPRNYNHAWCGEHRWEREKYKVKPYKELLPLWSAKRCPVHGLLRLDQCSKKLKGYICKLCSHEYQKNYFTPEKHKHYNEKYFLTRKDTKLKKRYNMSLVEYESMLKKQNYSCAICCISIDDHQQKKGAKKHFAVDHCHKTGNVRGLLCYKCNMGLGYFDDDSTKLTQALSYLSIKN
jgi:hypothetical protein